VASVLASQAEADVAGGRDAAVLPTLVAQPGVPRQDALGPVGRAVVDDDELEV
jgi:hypothetical protein